MMLLLSGAKVHPAYHPPGQLSQPQVTERGIDLKIEVAYGKDSPSNPQKQRVTSRDRGYNRGYNTHTTHSICIRDRIKAGKAGLVAGGTQTRNIETGIWAIYPTGFLSVLRLTKSPLLLPGS